MDEYLYRTLPGADVECGEATAVTATPWIRTDVATTTSTSREMRGEVVEPLSASANECKQDRTVLRMSAQASKAAHPLLRNGLSSSHRCRRPSAVQEHYGQGETRTHAEGSEETANTNRQDEGTLNTITSARPAKPEWTERMSSPTGVTRLLAEGPSDEHRQEPNALPPSRRRRRDRQPTARKTMGWTVSLGLGQMLERLARSHPSATPTARSHRQTRRASVAVRDGEAASKLPRFIAARTPIIDNAIAIGSVGS